MSSSGVRTLMPTVEQSKKLLAGENLPAYDWEENMRGRLSFGTMNKTPEESDADYIERLIQAEVQGMGNATDSSLRALRHKLLLRFHPDKHEDDTRYVDVILQKLSPENRWCYISSIPTVPKMHTADMQDALSNGIADAMKRAIFATMSTSGKPRPAQTPSSASTSAPQGAFFEWKARSDIDVLSSSGWDRRTVQHQIGRKVFWSAYGWCDVSATRPHIPCKLTLDPSKRGANFVCEKAAGHSGDCSGIGTPRKRKRCGVCFDADLREPLLHAFLKLVKERVFAPRGIQVNNVDLYVKHTRLILSNAHPLSEYLPVFSGNSYIANLFVEWSSGFDAWSRAIPSVKKRGNSVDIKGNGHAALHAIYEFSEERMQLVFDDAVTMVV